MKKQGMLALSLASWAVAAQAGDKPNVVIVYTDEHNFRTIEAYLPLLGEQQRHPWGEQATLQTPHLNALAQNGVLMNHCYVSTPVSTPSRASLMTGMYPQKTNCTVNDVALDVKLKTIAQCFAENGYDTGYAGKWHLSGSAKPGWEPTPDYGWQDNFYMFNRGHYKSIIDNNILGGYPLIDTGLKDNYEFMTDYLTDRAIDFVTAERQNPFLFCLSIPDPHGPNVVKKEYFDMYSEVTFNKPATAGKDMTLYPSWAKGNVNLTQSDYRNYWGMVKCIDDNVGRLVETLKDKGIYDNTIIVFTSDHGDMCGEHGREDKSIPLEASLKVPFIVCGPGLPQGKVVQEAVSNIDIYPTLADLCGLTGMPQVDGVSIAPLLKGESDYTPRNCVFSRATGGSSSGWLCVSTNRYKLVVSTNENDTPWLLDTQTDPDELHNFYNDEDYAEVVSDLTARLIEYCEQNAEPKFQNNKIRKDLGVDPIENPGVDDKDNLLINGNFEQTKDVDGVKLPENWETFSNVKNAVNVGSNGINKSNSLKFGLQGQIPECSARQTIEVEPGKKYVFTGYCYYANKPSGGKTASIRILDAEDNELYSYSIPATGTFGSSPAESDQSVIRTFEFVPTTTMVSIVLESQIDKLIRFDNLVVYAKEAEGGTITPTVSGQDLFFVTDGNLMLGEDVYAAQVYTMSGQPIGTVMQGAGTYSLDAYPSGVLFLRIQVEDGRFFCEKIVH